MKYYRVPAILELTGVGVAGMAGMRDPPPYWTVFRNFLLQSYNHGFFTMRALYIVLCYIISIV